MRRPRPFSFSLLPPPVIPPFGLSLLLSSFPAPLFTPTLSFCFFPSPPSLLPLLAQLWGYHPLGEKLGEGHFGGSP